ncbi:MAG: tRNA(Ile)-lysidine synthase [Acidobacteriota bacterium]|jgi:tRNA(Ile)-lysidine synthase|nr:tRNA(Ile)-lysidine synthase [Acidobacteriota bacterium]
MQKETDGKLSDFARALLAEWRALDLPRREARAVVALSGGADSTALLCALDELRKRRLLTLDLTVAHLDHGLRGRVGAQDARSVEKLARALGYEFETARARVAKRARATRDNLEQAARRERYEFLGRVARECGARIVATGHTLDDQAETVLLALLRGSGADGLGGMRAVRPLSDKEPDTLLARPLLGWARRAQTQSYCAARGVSVREDAMNTDERFARVRVRRQLIPLLETFNPRAVEAIARAAGLLQSDADALSCEASRLLREAADEGAQGRSSDEGARAEASREGDAVAPPLRVEAFVGVAAAVRRRAIRQWLALARGDLRRVELSHVLTVEKLLTGERGGRVAELPGGGRVERRGRRVFFRASSVAAGRVKR